VTYLKF